MVNFEILKLAVKQRYQTFWVIFKHCVFVLVFHRAFAKSAYFP